MNAARALDLPEGSDTELIARAIDLENAEAWRDPQGKVNVAVNPWYSTKDVDQTVSRQVKSFTSCWNSRLRCEYSRPKTLKQKLLASVAEVLVIQKDVGRKK
jgi:hypothetical protein